MDLEKEQGLGQEPEQLGQLGQETPDLNEKEAKSNVEPKMEPMEQKVEPKLIPVLRRDQPKAEQSAAQKARNKKAVEARIKANKERKQREKELMAQAQAARSPLNFSTNPKVIAGVGLIALVGLGLIQYKFSVIDTSGILNTLEKLSKKNSQPNLQLSYAQQLQNSSESSLTVVSGEDNAFAF